MLAVLSLFSHVLASFRASPFSGDLVSAIVDSALPPSFPPPPCFLRSLCLLCLWVLPFGATQATLTPEGFRVA